MNISLNDNGGRRTEGDRRLVNMNTFLVDRRSHIERRVAKSDKRCTSYIGNDYPERRALDLLMREKACFV